VRAESRHADTPKGQSTAKAITETLYAKSKTNLHENAEVDLGSEHDEAVFQSTLCSSLPGDLAKAIFVTSNIEHICNTTKHLLATVAVCCKNVCPPWF
jgi:hypothetical protein